MASFSSGFGIQTTSIVRRLLFLNFGIFAAEFILKLAFPELVLRLLEIFGLVPELVLRKFFFWQIFTYGFFHHPTAIFHLLFSMLSLWMFGSSLESHWGSKNFLKYYMFCIFGGGVAPVIAYLMGFPQGVVLGLLAPLAGLLVAFALIWPNREIYFWGIFPIKAKYLVIIFLLILAVSGLSAGVPVATELGGMAAGGLYFLYYTKLKYRFGISLPSFSFSRWRQKRKMNRWQEEMKNREKAKEEVDRLLEKISKEGMNSLNRKEKKFLKDASTKYYDPGE
ncbi:rhomboid family intramembrane serine protease [Leptospira semungkisensis]|uniref:Rhomboid family intramembrane serine protease n=1 Tax=Leptospira semungkisensis TaxID=2484985 RepID=A0A4R9FSP3_9LEPT|nr:rhomboid family intramembrane serine protease [Leptospira semungkisensis]TGK01674.1 rhomboid family intramembrane serine protease [Leptospira semungkisensis]